MEYTLDAKKKDVLSFLGIDVIIQLMNKGYLYINNFRLKVIGQTVSPLLRENTWTSDTRREVGCLFNNR